MVHKAVFFIPAESVYAIFEIRQDLEKSEIEYAGNKAESVRCLHRTSGEIPYAGGKYPPKKLHNIIAGILTLGNTWSPPFGNSFHSVIEKLVPSQRMDIGLSLQYGAFNVEYGSEINIKINEKDPLLSFFLNLFIKLQNIATVPLIVIKEYFEAL